MNRLISICLFVLMVFWFYGCHSFATEGSHYTIPQIDLSQKPVNLDKKFDSLFKLFIVDDGCETGSSYMAHPDAVLLEDHSILALYPQGHGMGPVLGKQSFDGGQCWGKRLKTLPEDWATSKETPTIYRLGNLDDLTDIYRNYLVMVSANPSWGGSKGDLYGHNRFEGNGFNVSLSADEGKSWSAFKTFFPYESDGYVNPIVAMASLTRLKRSDGSWDNRWMGLFHDYDYINYQTFLTIDKQGDMHWSTPKPYMQKYRVIERVAGMCEVECIRSNQGKGDLLVLLARSNHKRNNSLVSISKDEGQTWSEPFEVAAALNGERHKAEWLSDGRLFITFRSIERDSEKVRLYNSQMSRKWYSEGWVAWVGTIDDILNRREGQYRIKLAHSYLPYQKESQIEAKSDTGYCGNVVLKDGTVVTLTYGTFQTSDKTIIVSKRINMKLLDQYVKERLKF